MGIELSFAYPNDLLSFNINKNNLDYLRRLKYNSIHAPAMDIKYGINKTSKEVLQKISEIYKQINARNVVFHKTEIENYNLLVDNDFTISIENDDWRKPEHNVEDIEKILSKNKKLKFTFDFAHALSVSSSDITQYLNKFKDRLVEIHLSIINKDSEKHDFLHKYSNEKIINLLQPLKVFSVPVVLEAAVLSFEEIGLLEEEIEYFKKV